MIRIKVFPLKKIIQRMQIIFLILVFFITLIVLISMTYRQKNEKVKEVINMAVMRKSIEINKEDIINNILKNKIRLISNMDYDDLAENKEQNQNSMEVAENILADDKKDILEDNIKINIAEYKNWDKPKKYSTQLYENGKIKVGNVLISNYSKLNLDLNELQKVSNIEINNETNFLIFHTHTSETYSINKNEYSDYYRTQNENYNMLAIGNSLSKELQSRGYKALHEKTVHDFPSYNGAYKSSLKTVENCLTNEKYDFVIDIHRDAISSNENFRPTVTINEESAAKLMFVIGTNSAGLPHDNWMENLKLAIMIQNRAEEMYPGLFRELHLSSSRYNQQVSNGALILEVGATGNTIDEAKCAMKYFAEILDSMKKK